MLFDILKLPKNNRLMSNHMIKIEVEIFPAGETIKQFLF
jgi:hypothetical protein